MKYADEQVTTGAEAEAYASYIGGHLEGHRRRQDPTPRSTTVAPPRPWSTPAKSGRQRGRDRRAAGHRHRAQGPAGLAVRGETLRGLLLSNYAWACVGAIAGIAAYVAFAGAAVLLVLVVAGVIPAPHDRMTLIPSEPVAGPRSPATGRVGTTDQQPWR